MYSIYASKGMSEKFNAVMATLPKDRYNKIVTFLKNTPNGHPDFKSKFKKVGRNNQYDITDADRLIYRVVKKERRIYLGYIGDHDGAAIYLRRNRK